MDLPLVINSFIYPLKNQLLSTYGKPGLNQKNTKMNITWSLLSKSLEET